MLFTNAAYYIFLIAVFFAFWSAASRLRLRLWLIAAAGCFFYYQAAGRALALMIAVSAIDFATTRLMSRSENMKARKLLLALSLTVDIGALLVFKYADFFLENVASGLSFLGVTIPVAHLNLIVPIGISFFIFQSIAYVIDVYRRDAEPAHSYTEYLAFVAFFPTIIAGPILRVKQMLPQLRSRLTLAPEAGGQALFLIAMGLIKKIAIADYLSANLVDRVFDFPERFSSLEVWTAVYAYALQIYCDFSGYSDIAIGSALLLGFTLPVNFNSPYRSRNLAEFWRRWHISLSTWLRDYVFFTIAGRRARNAAILYFGLVATMTIGGLWHGAMWTFVVWGLMHGAGLAIFRAFDAMKKKFSFKPLNAKFASVAAALLTFHFVCLSWIFFRADGVERAFSVIGQMMTLSADTANLPLAVICVMMIGFIAHWIPDSIWEKSRDGFARLPALVQACVIAVVAVGLYSVASSDVVPFIYSRF
ncbi:MAG TPA: MBOAT family O-acyltransferase [Blastocatellia bacterium]